MYSIQGWFPSAGQMGGCGFAITLTQAWKEAVSKSELNQEAVRTLLMATEKEYLKVMEEILEIVRRNITSV